MVSVGHGKKLKDVINELAAVRKLQHRTYFRFSDSDHYTVLMFAHDQGGRLNAIVQLAAMPAVKEVVPMDVFKGDFEVLETHTPPPKAERNTHGVSSTT